MALRRLGASDEAAALLEQALALAEPDGAYRAFLDGGRRGPLGDDRADPADQPGTPASPGASWSGSTPRCRRAPRPAARASVPLTDSERAVLRFLPSHMTNEEISQALFLSINTVKTHLRSAYRKLGRELPPRGDRPRPPPRPALSRHRVGSTGRASPAPGPLDWAAVAVEGCAEVARSRGRARWGRAGLETQSAGIRE